MPGLALSLFLAFTLGSCSDDDGDDGADKSGGSAGQSSGGASTAGKGGSSGSAGNGQGGSAGASSAGSGGTPAGGKGGTGQSTGGGAGQSTGGSSSGGGNGGSAAGQGGGRGGAPPSGCIDDFDCEGLTCCDGKCVNRENDPQNCGKCGTQCTGDTPYCNGQCVPQPCLTTCQNAESCCGDSCCGAGEICCMRTFGAPAPECVTPVNGTCPVGCPECD